MMFSNCIFGQRNLVRKTNTIVIWMHADARVLRNYSMVLVYQLVADTCHAILEFRYNILKNMFLFQHTCNSYCSKKLIIYGATVVKNDTCHISYSRTIIYNSIVHRQIKLVNSNYSTSITYYSIERSQISRESPKYSKLEPYFNLPCFTMVQAWSMLKYTDNPQWIGKHKL